MNTTISPPVRIAALAGLLLAVGGGGTMLVMGRAGSSPTSAPPAPVRHRTVAKPATHPVVKPVAKPIAHRATHRTVRPATPAHRGNLVDARLPAPLQWALSQHRIVVVSLYDPRSDVDAISVAEAHAGSADAKVGFLLVNVLDNAVAGPLTALLPGGGLLPDPGILVYRAPGTLVYRADGFVDRAVVAQAAENAAAGQVAPSLAAAASASTP